MDRKKNLIAFTLLVAIIFAAITFSFSKNDGDISPAVIIMVLVLCISLSSLSKNIKKTKAEKSEIDKLITESPSHIDCDYGDYNCDFSHDNDERVKQLGEFLKNGIIDKAEYKTLLKKYSHNE